VDSAYFESIVGQTEADNLRIRQFQESVSKSIPPVTEVFHFAFADDDY
jgi:hypothetical protein